jgi:putative restriction endonuclease
MKFSEFYIKLRSSQAKYFVLDTYGNTNGEEEDFRNYVWETNRNNKIRTNDLFIYRRPKNASTLKEFYLFGVGRIGLINNIFGRKVSAQIEDSFSFNEYIFKKDLNELNLGMKPDNLKWQKAFVQYGITQISEIDFFEILRFAEKKDLFDDNNLLYDKDLEIEKYKKEITLMMDSKNYRVEDKESIVKVRVGQAIFSKRVKSNYKNKCAITGISNKDFLVASHIKPWSKDVDNRLNPKNGICLSVIYDKAFDKGYISFNDNFELIVSEMINNDIILEIEIKKNLGKKINTYGGDLPNIDFIRWHRENVYKNNKIDYNNK